MSVSSSPSHTLSPQQKASRGSELQVFVASEHRSSEQSASLPQQYCEDVGPPVCALQSPGHETQSSWPISQRLSPQTAAAVPEMQSAGQLRQLSSRSQLPSKSQPVAARLSRLVTPVLPGSSQSLSRVDGVPPPFHDTESLPYQSAASLPHAA